jgi:RNA polymerase sigma factor (sigma-70 family)
MVAAAGCSSTVEARDALSQLCQSYWRPLHCYVLSQGYNADDALDLTQEFFARLIEKNYSAQADQERGRFRSFLLAAVKHFLAAESRRARTQKRGNGIATVPLDFALIRTGSRTPAQIFERRWALTVIERAMEDLRNVQHFDQLKGCLMGREAGIPYADLARTLGLTEGALKVKIYRMRRRFGEALRAEIAQTVESKDQIEGELRYLLEVVSS